MKTFDFLIFLALLSIATAESQSWSAAYVIPSSYRPRQQTPEESKNDRIVLLIQGKYSLAHSANPISQHNAFVYLNKYWRNYWVGSRYYPLSSESQIVSRFKCVYPLTSEQSKSFVYQEPNGETISKIVFQCKKYFETCCGLDCCETMVAMEKPPGYYFGHSN